MKVLNRKIFFEFIPLIVKREDYENNTHDYMFLFNTFNVFISSFSIQIDLLFFRMRIIKDNSKRRKKRE